MATLLKERLRTDLQDAIRTRDQLRSSTLRLALTAIATEEVAGPQARELTDDEVVRILTREVRKRREAAAAYDDAGRDDRAAREREEGRVLEDYLPAQLSDDELRKLVAAAVSETNADGPRAMGQVMKAVQLRVAGRAEGGRVAAEVRRKLGG